VDGVTDVVVVGGGIAGSALAKVLAERGCGVTVLERQTTYRDKVRGEFMHPWGVAEAQRLGVEEVLLGTGGTWVTEAIGYDEVMPPEAAEQFPMLFKDLRPDMPGAMDVGHPQACEALARAAEAAGAHVVRGVGEVAVKAGPSPAVTYELDDVEYGLTCRLVVGADGRMSSVRRQLGLDLYQTEPRTRGGGMLIEGLDVWPEERVALGTEGDLHYLVFPRAGGLARLYQLCPVEQKTRFAGPNRSREFLDSFRLECLPLGEAIAAATPAGPVSMYPMNDSWTDRVAVPGVVLVGDAAGWNDPIIGEGLSIALRDARTVADVLTNGADWSVTAFADYEAERRERMRRLRLCAVLETDLRCTFTKEGQARRVAFFQQAATDPLLAAPVFVTAIAGPDVAPPEAFEQANIDRILALS
jgi:2-polyprenyl-6-methoxyphenol hydroxylase-like FAD-dependent oxidoreductase